MNKKLIIYLIIITIITTNFSGCIEPNQNNNQNGNISINGKGKYTSIQSAINNASNGDTINVKKGIYFENIEINKSIKLIGAGLETTFIDGNNTGDVIHISSEHVNISGFTIKNGGKGIYDACIYIYSNNATIKNNLLINSTYGVYIHREKLNNTIYNNTILNNQNGIYLITSLYNNISLNNITNNTHYGIYARDHSDSNILWRNIFSKNNDAMRIKTSKNNWIIENKIINNQDKGIYVCCQSNTNWFYKNTFIGNNKNADDGYSNQWNFNNIGNYWDDYTEKYPNAIDENNDGIWDIPYEIPGEKNADKYPLTNPI